MNYLLLRVFSPFILYPLNIIYHDIQVAGHFKLSGADNPGIVHKLTSVLVRNSLTIGNMKTSNEEAPFGGTELFTSKCYRYLNICV